MIWSSFCTPVNQWVRYEIDFLLDIIKLMRTLQAIQVHYFCQSRYVGNKTINDKKPNIFFVFQK